MKRLATVLSLLCAILAPLTGHAAAVVDTPSVLDALQRGAILWDVRATPEYQQGHIPSAVNIGDPGQVLRDANTEDFIAQEKIAQILGSAGIDPSKEVILYGGRGAASAHFGRFALRYFGGKAISVYHDGIDGWKAAGHPVSTAAHTLPPLTLTLTPNASVSLTTMEMRAQLNRPEVQILDVRTVKEYTGEDVRDIRGGHIPGAVNIPYERNWREPDTADKLAKKLVPDNSGMALKGREELQTLYAGLDPEKETVIYCQSGMRSVQTASVLEDLGFTKVRVYDASWLGYAAKLDAPVENETFFNVGALNARVAALMKCVEELEKQLAEVRAAAAGHPTMSQRRLAMVRGLSVLAVTPEAAAVAEQLVQSGPLPKKAEVDALHIGIAAVHGMEYVLTWNCRHIANARMRTQIEAVCRDLGYEPPIMCTPEELMEE
jgi:thiosulfate/3-mercaptopyruvate sulfurtransferase